MPSKPRKPKYRLTRAEMRETRARVLQRAKVAFDKNRPIDELEIVLRGIIKMATDAMEQLARLRAQRTVVTANLGENRDTLPIA